SYPVTIQLYNNASVNAQKRTQVAYGFRITEAGTGKVYTGVSDTVVFNNPAAPHSAPAHKPGFSVDGFAPTPQGLLRDAELDLVGDIGGDNSVFRSIHGTVNLDFWDSVSGSYTSVPSAYNFGTDTGESSTGIADYWTSSHTLHINQGPALLYGLWNAVPWASVQSGGIRLAGSISPSYGFVFVSNTAPVLDPWGTGERDNMSWLPTTNSGSFATMLPPLGAPWTSQYYVQAFAAGYAEMNGTPVTAATSGYALHLISAPGLLNAPLYMFSNVQAARLADAVTGSSSPPYDFNGLIDNMNFTFNHLNAFGYPSFVLFNAQGVTKAIYVNSTYQGQDSASGNFYINNFAPGGVLAATGILVPGPGNTSSLLFYTSGIDIYDGVGDHVTNQTLAGLVYGLQILLWQDQNVLVSHVSSELGGPGVWVGDSVDTTIVDLSVLDRGTGITDIGSSHTVGQNILVTGPSLGVEAFSSSDSTYSSVYVADGGFGFSTGADYGAEAEFDPYYYLPGTHGLAVDGLTVYYYAAGGNISLSEDTTFDHVSVTNDSQGVYLDASSGFTATQITVTNSSTGLSLNASRSVSISHFSAVSHSIGVYVNQCSGVVVFHGIAKEYSIGVWIFESHKIKVNDVSATTHSISVYVA
ncbi:MAG: thermopsin family protease, partial [Thermoplasmata archaeon]